LKPLKLQEVFDHLHESISASIARTSVRLTIRPTRLTLLLDSDRLQRVLQNLVTNAREALAQRDRGRITISARTIGKQCQILVADTGPGIPRDIRSTLFEPFVTHGKVGGTGLGLAIAKSVVEAHHGTIDFHSTRRGTTFIIQLPLMP
ncbi:MAG TPA: ATP-binding protein, partial [Candidatus Didemnitutus sp.]|nr:ATP-binding protein [Candidatus Didemnitutus sp.]